MKADRIVSDGKARLLEIHEHSPLRVVLYGLMFIVLLMQFRYIYMASDDFGYATLSYAASTSYDGAKGLFDYLKNHYNS